MFRKFENIFESYKIIKNRDTKLFREINNNQNNIKINENHINKNIISNYTINNFTNDKNNKIIDNLTFNKIIKKINNVYKQNYNNKFVTGFGDFIRGCYFILEFSQKYDVSYNITILHPINNYLKNKTNTIPDYISKNIEYCEYINYSNDINCIYNSNTTNLYKKLFEYFNKQQIYDENIFIYTVCYPTIQIIEENKNYIRNLIEPNDELKLIIENYLKNINLIKKKFKIIHIRSGDNFLNNNEKYLKNDYKLKIITEISKIIRIKSNFLLIADNILVKKLILAKFPFIKMYFNEITHLGENSKLNDDNIKNTLIDFYIMSYSNSIFSISSYDHGSGFSRWCAVTYDIPYNCIQIKI